MQNTVYRKIVFEHCSPSDHLKRVAAAEHYSGWDRRVTEVCVRVWGAYGVSAVCVCKGAIAVSAPPLERAVELLSAPPPASVLSTGRVLTESHSWGNTQGGHYKSHLCQIYNIFQS